MPLNPLQYQLVTIEGIPQTPGPRFNRTLREEALNHFIFRVCPT